MKRKPQQYQKLISDLDYKFNRQRIIQKQIDSHKPALFEKYEVYESKLNTKQL